MFKYLVFAAGMLLARGDSMPVPDGFQIRDEGTLKGRAVSINCSGAGITCAVSAGEASFTVPGGGGTGTPGGVANNIQINDGLGAFGAYTGTSCAYAVKTLDASGAATCTAAPTIPADISGAHYVTTQAEAGLSAEAVLPTCTGTDKLTFNGTTITCATDQTSAGGGYATVDDEAVALTARTTINFTGAGIACVDNAGATRTDCTVGAIPADLSAEPFITKVASANLSNEFALGSLATAILINTTTTGVPTAYAGATSCTNQFMTGLSSIGASTCTTDTLASAQHANQGTTTTLLHGNAAGNPAFSGVALADFVANLGTTTTVLHGNAAGQPTYGAVVLTTDVSGILGAANGGTGTSQGLGGCVTLGTATGATTTVGPVTWTGTFNTIDINYEITGYNGGTPVGRVLVGAASISTTALTDGSSGYEGVAGTLTNMLSIPGAPLAITLSSIGRAGTYHLFGRSGAIKRYWIEGQDGNASVSAASVVYRSVGNFSDLGTNLPIQRAQLTVYDTLTATAASAQTFNTGTTITVRGCP